MKCDLESTEAEVLRGLVRRADNAGALVVILEFVEWAEAWIPTQSAGEAQE